MDDDTIAQFTEVTGSTAELATQYLEIADYDIQQAMQLYFENGGAEIRPSAPSHTTPTAPRPSESAHNAVQIDSDDDLLVDEVRSSAPPRPQADGAFEDDAAMARRLQEELYSGGDSSDGVRAPIARTTETLVGPGAESYGDLDPLLDQFRMRQARNSRLSHAPYFERDFKLISVFISSSSRDFQPTRHVHLGPWRRTLTTARPRSSDRGSFRGLFQIHNAC
jgi:hypothetical protein